MKMIYLWPGFLWVSTAIYSALIAIGFWHAYMLFVPIVFMCLATRMVAAIKDRQRQEDLVETRMRFEAQLDSMKSMLSGTEQERDGRGEALALAIERNKELEVRIKDLEEEQEFWKKMLEYEGIKV